MGRFRELVRRKSLSWTRRQRMFEPSSDTTNGPVLSDDFGFYSPLEGPEENVLIKLPDNPPVVSSDNEMDLTITNVLSILSEFLPHIKDFTWPEAEGMQATLRRLKNSPPLLGQPFTPCGEGPTSDDPTCDDGVDQENDVPESKDENEVQRPPSAIVSDDTRVQSLLHKLDEMSTTGDIRSSVVSIWDSHAPIDLEVKDDPTIESVTAILRSMLFQMYCLLSECSICLSALGTYGGAFKVKGLRLNLERFVQQQTDNESQNALALRLLRYEPNGDESDEPMISSDEGGVPFKSQVAFLPCGHKFCRGCLDDVVINSATEQFGDASKAPDKMRIRCPTCRKKIKCSNVCGVGL